VPVLSLSEHLPFVVAYALSSLAVIGTVAGYSRAILGTLRRMLVVAAGATTLYVYLYVVLTDEDTALLVGAIGLFVVLGLVMIVTRRIDWYRLAERETV
jgi:inner membrane protein